MPDSHNRTRSPLCIERFVAYIERWIERRESVSDEPEDIHELIDCITREVYAGGKSTEENSR